MARQPAADPDQLLCEVKKVHARLQELRCELCRGWFAVSPDVNRPDRKYCSERCRAKTYRNRKAEARALKLAAMKPPQIAKKLETDMATVRGWLAAKPSKRRQRL